VKCGVRLPEVGKMNHNQWLESMGGRHPRHPEVPYECSLQRFRDPQVSKVSLSSMSV